MVEELNIHELTSDQLKKLLNLCYEPEKGYLAMQLELCYIASQKYKKTDFNCRLLVYKISNQIVAWCLAQDLVYRFEKYCDVGIFVDVNFRKKGIASELIDFLLNDTSLQYSAWVSNDANLNLYKKFMDRITLFDMNYYTDTQIYKKFHCK